MIRNRRALTSTLKWALIASTALFVSFMLTFNTATVSASPFVLSQAVPVAAATPIIDRLSWGAIIAGALLALIVELALNLLGIALNFNSINPRYEGESATPSQLAQREIIWIAVTTFIALFTGGAVAGRFTTSPERIDGTLHGLVVWGLVTIITLLLLTTTIGRILSGTATLIGQGLSLAGQTAGAVAQGVGSVAQGVGSVAGGVAQGAANVASSAAQGAASVASSAAQGISTAAQTASNAAQNAGVDVTGAAKNVSQTVSDRVQNAVGSVSPDLQQALQQRETVQQAILAEGRKLLEQAGVNAQDVQSKAQGAVADVQKAAQDAVQNPQNAGQILTDALTKVFQTGQGVASQVDRQSVIDIMVQRGHMTPEQADQQLHTWEQQYNQVSQQSSQLMDQAKQQAAQIQSQVQQKAAQLQDQAQRTLDQTRVDAERMAREAAQATAKAISRIALAAFFAILVGGIAAGLGGFIGTPDDVVASGVAVTATTVPNSAIAPNTISTPIIVTTPQH